MNQTAEGSGASFMEKVSAFIVDKRSLIFLITIILLIFSAFSRNWVEVESDLTYYLPEDSETKQALNVMDEQFITYGTAKIMVANITLDEAAALCKQRSRNYAKRQLTWFRRNPDIRWLRLTGAEDFSEVLSAARQNIPFSAN